MSNLKVGFVFHDKALITGIALAAEMLNSAAGLRNKNAQKQAPLQIQLIAGQPGIQVVSAGLRLQPDINFDDAAQMDILILPPMWGNPFPVLAKASYLKPWIVQQYEGGAKILATGTGVCWLAECGLLEHQVATTHWYFYQKFLQRYPNVKLNRRASITEANGLYCAGSINSQSEMILYFIAELYGQKIANIIETHFSHEISKSGSQPFYQLGGQLQFDESIALAQDWMKSHLSENVTAKEVAAVCQLSLRTFNRRFKEQVGEPPHQYLLRIRMQNAKTLLRDLGLTIQDVAELVGYRDPYHFSCKFKLQFNMTPKQYREMVKAKSFKA